MYTMDYLTKKRVKNNGQLNQYYVNDCLDVIIPPKIYYKIQEIKVKFLDSTAIFYEAYDDNEMENIVNELNDRYEYYQKMLLKDVSDREDVKRRIRIIEGELQNITEARRQIAIYRDIKGNTEIITGRSENKQKFRDFDEVLVQRLVKKIELVNQEKCNVVLNSGQIINISLEMDT